MIGGEDQHFEIRGRVDTALKRHVLRNFSMRWPDLVVEIAVDGSTFTKGPGWVRKVVRFDELFLYPNKRAYESWTAEGSTKANANQMVHLLWNENSLTLVVDDASEARMGELLDDVEECLRPGHLPSWGMVA